MEDGWMTAGIIAALRDRLRTAFAGPLFVPRQTTTKRDPSEPRSLLTQSQEKVQQ
jgi:hypothetical protein